MANPGDDLTPELREALKHIPQKLGSPVVDDDLIDELKRLGYVRQLLGGLGRTAKGEAALHGGRRR